MSEPFSERLSAAAEACGAAACVGIDPHLHLLPAALRHRFETLRGESFRMEAASAVQEWSLGVVEAIVGVVPAVKPQVAFFEALGAPGAAALETVVAAARGAGLLVVLDAKRGDIGSTAEAYARATLDEGAPLESDALTVAPYLGPSSLEPFLRRCDQGRGLFVLVRTSNPGSEVWQRAPGTAELVADWIEHTNQTRLGATGFGPVGAVVAANLGEELGQWRERMPSAWFLMPGVGAQGATASDVASVVGRGALVTASRSVLFGVDAQEDWKNGVHQRAHALVAELVAAVPPLP